MWLGMRKCCNSKEAYRIVVLDSHLEHIVAALDSKLLIYFIFDGETVTIPSPLALDVESIHVRVACDTILADTKDTSRANIEGFFGSRT
jgi:hypothetical protein